ncbi:MAG: hypothetical protein ACI89X_000051 [Planctomycetota bacterium]|jgi:hypothetical protein
MLDEKIECTECHRVFFVKSTVGKRVTAPDHTKTYIGFGIAVVAIIGLFIMASGDKEPVKKKVYPKIEVAPYGRSDHPRALGLAAWAQSIGKDNQLVMTRHTDLTGMAAHLNLESADAATVMAALQKDKSTLLLRTMECGSTMLESDADMTAASGTGLIYVTPRSGDDTFKKNTAGIFTVAFTADGDTVKVSSFTLKQKPVYMPGKDPSIVYFKGNKDIAKPDEIEITDSAGTRKVAESKPTAVPHWEKATPEQRAMADEIVAGILAAAEPDAPGALFNRATNKIQSSDKDGKKATVPRVLNAMFEAYGDVIGNHQKLILLDRALYQWTGYAVNYPSRPTGNNETDTKLRQSCIRQWFAHWYRYYDNLDEFFDSRENLEDDEEEEGGGGK